MSGRIIAIGDISIEPVVFVYHLCDPDTMEVRYVGRALYPALRLYQHLNHTHNKRVRNWIDELDDAGKKPVMRVLARVEGWKAGMRAERCEIKRQREAGAQLLNYAPKENAAIRFTWMDNAMLFAMVRPAKPIHRNEMAERLLAYKCLLCDRAPQSRGLCALHYRHAREAIRSVGGPEKQAKAEKRFIRRGMILKVLPGIDRNVMQKIRLRVRESA